MRTVIVAVAATIVLALLVVSGLVYSGSYYVGADEPHWSTTAWLMNQARNRAIRANAADIAEPAGLNDRVKIVAGVSHYSEHCAVCHGAPGVERGDLAKGLYPRPPSLINSAKLYTPAELFWIVKHGIRMTGMPSWADHSDNELWATVAFIEKLPGMTDQDYTNLVAASREQGGHNHENQQPAIETTPPPAAEEHDQPASPAATQRPGAAGKGHDHATGRHHH